MRLGLDEPISSNERIEKIAQSLGIPQEQIDLAKRNDPGPLEICLYRFGFLSVEQLDQVYDLLHCPDNPEPTTRIERSESSDVGL